MSTQIMVIDDEPLIGQLLTYQLCGAGYTVWAYQDYREALQAMAGLQPDLIILDVMMPFISGWDLCRLIRTDSNVPIIMLTAKDSDEDVVHGLTSGADDYVSKPFSAAQLIARIEAVLRRARATQGRQRVAPAPSAVAPASPPIESSTAPAPTNIEVLPADATPLPPPLRVASNVQLPRLGPHFAAKRRARGMSLRDVSEATGVRWEFLQAIEQEEFSYVPRAELRNALRAYSDLLELDLRPYKQIHPKQLRQRRNWIVIINLLIVIMVGLGMLAVLTIW
ncbi:MAG: response regulator [Oscillochloridaceae bacterium umkhey_bin13]